MRTLSLLAAAWLASVATFAQKIIEQKLPWQPGQEVRLDLRFADSIRVSYWDQPTVSVRIAVTINGGRLNDALRVETTTDGPAVRLSTDFDKERIKQGRPEDCPDQAGHHSRTSGRGYSVCSEINYVVQVPRAAPLQLETINGNVEITGATAAVRAKSISGYVDVNWAAQAGAAVSLKSISGEVFSDLDIAYANRQRGVPLVGYEVRGTLGSGGSTVQLESISGNVYLRKRP